MTFTANEAYQLCYWLDTAPTLPPTAPPSGWSFHFVPAELNNNYAVILQNNADAHQFAVVIQGTHDKAQILDDLAIDSPVDFKSSMRDPIIAGARIANGADAAFANVLGLHLVGSLTTLEEILTSIPWEHSSVLITGHSLGGTIASLLAPWLAASMKKETPLKKPLPSNIQAVTFAAFAAGNQPFADYLSDSAQYQANINVNDIVPYVWATTGPYRASHIHTMFDKVHLPMPEDMKVLLKCRLAKIPQNFNYIQTSNPTTFAGTLTAAPSFSDCNQKDVKNLQWAWEVSLQHNYAYCVQYIGNGCQQPDAKCPKS